MHDDGTVLRVIQDTSNSTDYTRNLLCEKEFLKIELSLLFDGESHCADVEQFCGRMAEGVGDS